MYHFTCRVLNHCSAVYYVFIVSGQPIEEQDEALWHDGCYS